MRNCYLLPVLLVLSACLVLPPTSVDTPIPSANQTPAPEPASTEIPIPSKTLPLPTKTAPPPEPTDPVWTACSPLAGFALTDLPDHITNPFAPPPPGSDEPHQGIDLSDFLPNTQIAIAGRPVQAALAGQVALVISDRFPWGNAILIETPLEPLAVPFALPTPFPEIPLHSNLTCPGETAFEWNEKARSLYILYAHMQSAPSLQPGEGVACGQEFSAIGNTGNALNPHLHLEARIGPAGARFTGMAHYTSSAGIVEMDTYCTWRVSGWFQLIDPAGVLGYEE